MFAMPAEMKTKFYFWSKTYYRWVEILPIDGISVHFWIWIFIEHGFPIQEKEEEV